MESSNFSNLIFRWLSGTLGFSYVAHGLVGTWSSSFSGLPLCDISSLSISLWSSPSEAVGGCWVWLAARWPPWSVGGAGLFTGGQSSLIEAGLVSDGGLRWKLDWLGGGWTEAVLSWFKFPACSQRFFRALRLLERRGCAPLSKDYEKERKNKSEK